MRAEEEHIVPLLEFLYKHSWEPEPARLFVLLWGEVVSQLLDHGYEAANALRRVTSIVDFWDQFPNDFDRETSFFFADYVPLEASYGHSSKVRPLDISHARVSTNQAFRRLSRRSAIC